MSLQRAVTPVTSSSLFLKYLATAATRSYPLPSTNGRGQRNQSSKRELYTQPAYRPHSLPEDFSPPPRNSGIPDTSIAGPRPDFNNSQIPWSPEKHGTRTNDAGEETASISFPEREAQKSKPVDPPKIETSASPAKPKRKLRAKKAAITITPSAASHLRQLLDQPEPKLIRVGTRNRGCSGLQYHLEYVDKNGSFDEVVEQDGVKVLIDSKALFSIIGSEMDWQEDKLSARFVFKNPNIKEQCGCGESFMV